MAADCSRRVVLVRRSPAYRNPALDSFWRPAFVRSTAAHHNNQEWISTKVYLGGPSSLKNNASYELNGTGHTILIQTADELANSFKRVMSGCVEKGERGGEGGGKRLNET